jgi:hypothetical protein
MSVPRHVVPKFATSKLHTAVLDRQNDRLQLLLEEFEMQPLRRDWRGDTPLHLAARKGFKAEAETLLRFTQGFGLDVKNVEYETPLETAVACHHDDIAALTRVRQASEGVRTLTFKNWTRALKSSSAKTIRHLRVVLCVMLGR